MSGATELAPVPSASAAHAEAIAPIAPATAVHPWRLLVLSSDTFPPQRVDVSVLFGEELSGRGHRIDWILQSEAECAHAYESAWGGGIAWVAATDRGTSLLRRLRKHVKSVLHDALVFPLLRTGRYDAIEVKDKFLGGIFALLAARWYRKRLIYWLSFPFPEFYLLRAKEGMTRYPRLYRVRGAVFRFILYRVLLPAADHVFVQSEQMRRDIAALGFPLAKLTAVPMGVKAVSTGPAAVQARALIPAGEPCFVYLGALGRERRLEFLLRVLQRVSGQMPGAKLYLVGRAEAEEDETFLKAEAQRLGVGHSVVFVGQLPQAQALRYVREADVCVSPFYPTPILNSTSPTKLVEYMALGKAVVANIHPEQRLLIEASGGGLCVPYEESAFAQAILELLRAPQRAQAMGELGRDYVAQFRTYAVLADLVERKMNEVIGA